MNNNGSGGEGKSAQIADAAAKVAERLASPEAQARLLSAAAASRDRAKAIVQGAIVDPKFLAKRVTFSRLSCRLVGGSVRLGRALQAGRGSL